MLSSGNNVNSTSVSRWLLWFAATIAGPPRGSRARLRTLSPSTTSTTGYATSATKSIRSRGILVVQIADEMKEKRRGTREAVEPVEDAAMPGQQRAAVLHADVAFY